MTSKELKKIEKELKPCQKCGGKLVLSSRSSGGHKKGIEHTVIRCKQCGEWYGGFTKKKKIAYI